MEKAEEESCKTLGLKPHHGQRCWLEAATKRVGSRPATNDALEAAANDAGLKDGYCNWQMVWLRS